MTAYDYIHDGNAIYERSFAIIRTEADLSRFSEEEADVAVRMIHACGVVEAAQHFVFSKDFVTAARNALVAGAPVMCDAEMVSRGVTVARLPANNEVLCTLRDPQTAEIAKQIGNTRSAAALELWRDRLDGALVAIGNAPTALFYLLEMIGKGAPRPAAIIGMPVGFVTSTDDSRQAISACPGAPECASGHIPARRIAAEITSEYSSLLDGSVHLHVSGCAKGCAHPAASDIVVVGTATGMGLIVDGTARDEPLALADSDNARRGLAGIAALVSAERRAGELTAQAIQRIGLSALAEAFGRRK